MIKFRKTILFINSVSSFRIGHLSERYNPVFLFLFVLFSSSLFLSCSQDLLGNNDRIASFLEEEALEYEIDHEGDFRIIGNGTFPGRDVWIRGHINHSGDVGVREIFSLSARVNGYEIEKIAPVLLVDNTQTRVIGSWSLIRDDERDIFLIIYTVKAPVCARKDYILQSLKEVSEAASVLERVLSPEN